MVVLLSPALEATVLGQVLEDPRLGATSGLNLKVGAESQVMELGGERVEKDVLNLHAEYTFSRWLLIGVKADTGSVWFRGAESDATGNAAVFGKALLTRGTRKGGLDLVTVSVETMVSSSSSAIGGTLSGTLAARQLQLGLTKGSTRTTLAAYSADGPINTMLGAQFQFNRSENDLKLGNAGSVYFGINGALLPYQRSQKQVIGGVEVRLDLRQSSSQSGLGIANTGGSGVMASPTLRFLPSPNLEIFGAISLPLVENYGSQELSEKRSVKIGMSVSF